MVRRVLISFVCFFCIVSTSMADPIRLRYANFPPAGTFPCVQMDRWIKEVHRLTNGKVQVDAFPAGSLLDARSMMRGVLRGQADIGCFSTAYYAGVFPQSSAFELPLGFRSSNVASRVLMETILAVQPADLAKFKILTAFTSPPSQVMSRKPLATLNDLQNLSLRASGIMADEVALLGGRPVSMPQSEAPEAIQRGAVDGVFSSLDVAKDLNYAESCPHGLLTDLSVYPFVVVMNKKVWDALPSDVQTALDNLALPHAQWTGTYVDNHATSALEWAKSTYKVDYRPLNDAERAEVQQRMLPLVQRWKEQAAGKGVDPDAMLTAIEAAQQRIAQHAE